MMCEEYVVNKLIASEATIESQEQIIRNLETKVFELQESLRTIKEVIEYTDNGSLKKYNMSIYSTYDPKEFEKLFKIFGVIEKEDK